MGRPKLKAGESLIEIPCKVPQWVVDKIEEIHIQEDRPRSQIARMLIVQGLAALEESGQPLTALAARKAANKDSVPNLTPKKARPTKPDYVVVQDPLTDESKINKRKRVKS